MHRNRSSIHHKVNIHLFRVRKRNLHSPCAGAAVAGEQTDSVEAGEEAGGGAPVDWDAV